MARGYADNDLCLQLLDGLQDSLMSLGILSCSECFHFFFPAFSFQDTSPFGQESRRPAWLRVLAGLF